MTAHIVWDWAADCSRPVVLRRQRSCLKNCCWQRVLECRQNAVVWHERRRRADSRRPGNTWPLPDNDRWTRVSKSWSRHAAARRLVGYLTWMNEWDFRCVSKILWILCVGYPNRVPPPKYGKRPLKTLPVKWRLVESASFIYLLLTDIILLGYQSP